MEEQHTGKAVCMIIQKNQNFWPTTLKDTLIRQNKKRIK